MTIPDIEAIAKIAAKIDGGCGSCISSFCNDFIKEFSLNDVQVIGALVYSLNKNSYMGVKFKYNTVEKRVEADY